MASKVLPAFVICSALVALLMSSGCTSQADQQSKTTADETILLAFQPEPNSVTKYRIITEAHRSTEWQGPVPNKESLKQGHNDNRLEIIFSQFVPEPNEQIEQETTPALIKIEQVKYSSTVQGRTDLEFDSSTNQDPNHPFAKLVGQTYGITFTPDNHIPTVFGLSQGRHAVSGPEEINQIALRIFSPELIRERHGTPAFPKGKKQHAILGDSWSTIKTFAFNFMGLKSYERVYTLRDVVTSDGHRLAKIEMNAIPTSKLERRFQKERMPQPPTNFDSTDSYTGTAEVDLTDGLVNYCSEQLTVTWTGVLPPDPKQGTTEPVVLKMSAGVLHRLERID